MRTHLKCPKCAGTTLYVCENMQPDQRAPNTLHTHRVFTAEIDQKQVGATEGSKFRTDVGSFETWICATCGYTEWYAKDPERLLERLAAIPGSGVQLVRPVAPAPYR